MNSQILEILIKDFPDDIKQLLLSLDTGNYYDTKDYSHQLKVITRIDGQNHIKFELKKVISFMFPKLSPKDIKEIVENICK